MATLPQAYPQAGETRLDGPPPLPRDISRQPLSVLGGQGAQEGTPVGMTGAKLLIERSQAALQAIQALGQLDPTLVPVIDQVLTVLGQAVMARVQGGAQGSVPAAPGPPAMGAPPGQI